ncbi:MAG: glycosyltransferase [Chloroflexota bacterium]|nr:glycosyltransferase [Chloroflexota bacterium]
MTAPPVAAAVEAQTPALSVTILNYNYANYLPQCLDSVLSQTMRDFEVILINDCSTDNSREVIQKYLHDPRVRLVDHPVNRGYVASLLEGCRLSSGRYMTVISADDYAIEPQAFALACAALEADDATVLAYSAWHQVDDQRRILHTRRGADADYVHHGPDEFRRLLLSSPVLHSGALIRRSAYQAVGGYDERCRYSVDTNMWLALCSVGKVAYIDRPLYAYRTHGTNLSNSQGALWDATGEMLLGIDAAIDRFPEGALANPSTMRREARQRALLAVPTVDVFAGRYARGWRAYWEAFRRYPLATAAQPRTATLLLRTVLGERNFDRLRDFAQRVSRAAHAPTHPRATLAA